MLCEVSLKSEPELEVGDWSNVISYESVRCSLRKTEDGSLGWLVNAVFSWYSLSNKELGERIFLISSHSSDIVFRVARVDAARRISELGYCSTWLDACNSSADRDSESSRPFFICVSSAFSKLCKYCI